VLTRVPRRWLLLVIAGLIAVGIAFAEYRALGILAFDEDGASQGELQVALPWGGLAGRRMAAAVESHWRRYPEAAEDFLAWQLQRYPVDHSRWYQRAIIAQYLGRAPDLVLAHLDAAVAVQPRQRETRWRAATLAQLLGHPDLAVTHLRQWLDGQPHATEQALLTASRSIHELEELLDRVVPDGEAYLTAVLRFARQHGRVNLARAAWTRLPGPRPPGDAGLLDFVDLGLATGDHEAAMAAWADTFSDYRPGQVPNADFLHDLGSPNGLNWNTRMPAGSRASRDPQRFVTEPASLRLDFDGRESLHLGRPSVRIPVVQHDGGWVLSGYWRGQGLTTRALPYLSVWPEGGRRVRVNVPAATFEWTPFRIEIEAEEGSEASVTARLLHLQVGRDAPQHHFDRFLAGSLWLDALRVERLDTDRAE
jgi:hypothetical protein